MLFQVACVVELGVEELCGGCERWWQWWQQLRVPHGFCVPEQRAERLQGGGAPGVFIHSEECGASESRVGSIGWLGW